jgi:hypothetical protein
MSVYNYHSYDYTFWKFYDSVITDRYGGDDGAFVKDYRNGVFAGENIPQLNAPLPGDNHTARANWDEQRMWRPLDRNGEPVKKYNGYVREGFFEGYAEGLRSIIKEFARHIDYNIENKGWSRDTLYQVFFNDKQNFKTGGWNGSSLGNKKTREEYLKWGGFWDWENNKPSVSDLWLARYSQPGTSWWQLDEPERRTEWEALGFICGIVMQAKTELNLEKPGLGDLIKMRTDISRSYTQYDSMDGRQDIPVYNKTFLDPYKNENNGAGWGGPGLKLARQRVIDFGEEWWAYNGWSGANSPYSNNTNRILSVYAFGGKGFLSYEYFANNKDINYGYYNPNDREASFVWGGKLGINAPLASFGMKAAGQVSELTRYLDALKAEYGYTRRQTEQYIAAFINIHGRETKQNVQFADGSSAVYIPDSYTEPLKRDILAKLAAKAKKTPAVPGGVAASRPPEPNISVNVIGGKNYTVRITREGENITVDVNLEK